MHSTFFGIKRAHLCVLARSRPLLVRAESELTPARFDMMRIISLHAHGVAQTRIIDLLGVSAATVSRMLKSLEQLGFVARSRAYAEDARRLLVRITKLGSDRVRRGLAATVSSRVADLLAARGVTGNILATADDAVSRDKVAAFEAVLVRMRNVFGDPTPVRHPWHTESIVPMIFTTLVDGRLFYTDEAG